MKEQKQEKKETSKRFPVKKILYIGCFIPLLVFFCLAIIVISQRKNIEEAIFDELNQEVVRRDEQELKPPFEIIGKIYTDLAKSSDKDEQIIILTEDELSILLTDTFPELDKIQADSEVDELEISWEILSREDNTLYGVVRIVRNQGQNQIKHIGTGRIGVPKIITKFIITKSSELIDQANENESIEALYRELIKASPTLKIVDILYKKDIVEIKVKQSD